MKNWLRESFGFTKREYNGLMVLFTIVLSVTVLPYFYARYVVKTDVASPEELLAINKLNLIEHQKPFFRNTAYVLRKGISPAVLFKFDPNQIDFDGWRKLGLSERQAKSMLNYRSKGGKFFKPEDLQKMYAISPAKYEQLKPYIDLPDKKFVSIKTPFAKKEDIVVEINGADTIQLDQIKGVGMAFARRIAKYRDRLGGFYQKEQLLEVFGIDSLKYNEIKGQISIDLSKVRKLTINTAEFETLKNHPYLTYKQINAILQYRKQHGKYNNAEDLRKVAILTPQNIQNLLPYLVF